MVIPSERAVRIAPAVPSETELANRRRFTRPDPAYHAGLRKQFEAEKNPFAAAVHHSLEHRARGLLAAESFDPDAALAHLLTAELLKPKPKP